ncbi:MAG: hypothetical protein IPM29_21275 [Planctomycetes bacterium]|nr:hypothetical protein [Planctomycetota bacterium]
MPTVPSVRRSGRAGAGRPRPRPLLWLPALLALHPAPARTQGAPNIHATRVVAFDEQGRAGGGIFAPPNALGAPDGALGVHSLGIGGSLTLGFDVTIQDGPGADLIVFENAFASSSEPWTTFAEVCFVEVSSNGVDFARVPSRYTGPQVDPGAFAFVHTGFYAGLGGTLPTRLGAADPEDIVLAGGDPIDLAELGADPLVIAGRVDLRAIALVRLVDVRSGVDVDASGAPIRDAGAGSADIDAVTVLHHAGNAAPRGPQAQVVITLAGDLRISCNDPDGIADLDLSALRTALWGVEVPAIDILQALQPRAISPTSITLGSAQPLPGGIPLRLAFALRDFAGAHSGAIATR